MSRKTIKVEVRATEEMSESQLDQWLDTYVKIVLASEGIDTSMTSARSLAPVSIDLPLKE